jgi:signal transduction histidine kinase
VETPFVELLRHLAESMSIRATVQIKVHAENDERPLPPEVQIGLYRITQEALNNVVKHASANRADVHYRRHAASADLRIRDDGRGFDASSTPPGHLGVSIMRERARGIRAELRLHSRIGLGTRIDVHWNEAGMVAS